MKKVAVIPARGGSTRLKNKNIYPLAGKPLIVHTLQAVWSSKCFDRVYVSTDSDEIADVAKSFFPDTLIYKRADKFSNAKATVVSALIDMMGDIEKADIFSYFLPTCPFRNSKDIQKAIELIPSCDFVVSIADFSEPLQLGLHKFHDYVIPAFDNLAAGLTNSLYMRKFYRPSGGIYMGHWDKILKHGNFFNGEIKSVYTPKERAIDINDIYDVKYAEMLVNDGVVKLGNQQ